MLATLISLHNRTTHKLSLCDAQWKYIALGNFDWISLAAPLHTPDIFPAPS